MDNYRYYTIKNLKVQVVVNEVISFNLEKYRVYGRFLKNIKG